MSAKAIKNELKTIMTGLQYNSVPAFAAVIDNFTGQFENYPSVRIVPQDIPAEIATNVQNDRTVVLTAIVYIAHEATDRSETAAIDLGYDFIDLVSNAIDTHSWDSVTNNTVEAAGVRWLFAVEQTGGQVVLEFDVRVTYSKDV